MAEPENGRSPRQTADGRPSASSMIAEMWNEREQSTAPPPFPPEPGRRGGPTSHPKSGRTGLVAGVVALALLLGGGVGVFLATQGVGMPSVARYVAKADAICGPSNGSVALAARPTSYPDLTTRAGVLTTTTDAQLGGLKKLKHPGGADGGRVATLLADMTQTSSAGRSLQDAAGRGDDAATSAATVRLRTAADATSTAAKDLGLKACAVGMQPGIDAVVSGANGVVKTAFVAKSDNLCRATARALDAVQTGKGNAAISRYLSQTQQLMDKLVVDLKAMTVPPGDEATIADVMAALDKVMAKWAEAPGAAAAGDVSRITAIDKEMGTLETAADAKLDAYGLGTCGSNFGG